MRCGAGADQTRTPAPGRANLSCRPASGARHANRTAGVGAGHTGAIALERNDLAAAERLLGDGIVLARQGGLMDDVALGFALSVRLRLGRVTQMARLPLCRRSSPSRRCMGFNTRICLHRPIWPACNSGWTEVGSSAMGSRDSAPARRRAARIRGNDPSAHSLATDELEALPAILHSLLERATAAGCMQSCIEALLLFALCHHTKGDTAAALDRLGKSLRLAAAEGYTRIFLDEGKALLDLLPWACHRGA